jgi:hypothetical protein
MLSYFKKYLLLAVPCVAPTSGVVFGQDGFYNQKKTTSFTIGFQTGREQVFRSLSINRAPTKVQVATRNTIVFRTPINNHFKLETGLSYNTIPNNIVTIKGLDKKNIVRPNNTTTIPLTLQYCIAPSKTRVQVYFGAGVQCNINSASNPLPNFNCHTNPDYRAITGTKYINLVITQGITFQINARIRLNQSFHFIPGADTVIGFDLGIGYKIR